MQSVKKIWKTLNSSQRIKLLHMFFLTMISMFLEILGVGLAIPAINLLIKKDIVSEYPQLMPMMEYFNYPTHLQIMIFGMVKKQKNLDKFTKMEISKKMIYCYK